MLERDGLEEFELQFSDAGYTIRGQLSRKKSDGPSLWEKIFRSAKHLKNGHQAEMFERCYKAGEILQFETDLRVRRKEDRRIPEPNGPSQILRGVGGYLDKREGCRLVSVTVKDRWVTINYLVRDGRPEKFCQDFQYFYDYGVKMYLHRSNRSKVPPSR